MSSLRDLALPEAEPVELPSAELVAVQMFWPVVVVSLPLALPSAEPVAVQLDSASVVSSPLAVRSAEPVAVPVALALGNLLVANV